MTILAAHLRYRYLNGQTLQDLEQQEIEEEAVA